MDVQYHRAIGLSTAACVFSSWVCRHFLAGRFTRRIGGALYNTCQPRSSHSYSRRMTSPDPVNPSPLPVPADEPLIEEAKRLLRDSPDGLEQRLLVVLDRLEQRLDEAFVAGLTPRR